MSKIIDWKIVLTLAKRTLSQYFESLIAYIVFIFIYGLTGGIFSFSFFLNNQASIDGIAEIAPWALWFSLPALTMSLISDEIKTGTFEQLTTLPLRDWEIVLGKYLGFAGAVFVLILGLCFYPIFVASVSSAHPRIDWGAAVGVLAGLYFLCLTFGAMGIYASSLTKNQVVSFIVAVTLTSVFFFIGQFYTFFPGFLAQVADFLGVNSHLSTLNHGVWDFRDLFYFISMIGVFLYFTVQKLGTRRF